MKARIYRFLANDLSVAYAIVLIACMGLGGSFALFEARLAGWL